MENRIVVILSSKEFTPMQILNKLLGAISQDIRISDYLAIQFSGMTSTKLEALSYFVDRYVHRE